MVLLNRIRIDWAGTPVTGASVTTLHYDATGGAVPDVAKVLTAFQGIASSLPTGLTITVPNSGDVIDSATGVLQTTWTGGVGGTATGSDGTTYPKGVGAVLTMLTAGVANGRRVRGRVFLVPLGGSGYATDGTINNALLGPLAAVGTNLMAAGPLMIWHRPKLTAPGTGGAFLVTTTRVPDKVAILRSRRD